ncbi:DNA-binding transcriptional regulator BolA [Xylocopa sonorina]|uniref:DNA-binding transcriptional regulator BolA n=1 Tax=Xylocopa sonorina TaxID=1818115 RepID=UPI00403AFF3E
MYKTIVVFGKKYRETSILLQKMSSIIQTNPVEGSIRKKLVDSLSPSYIEVINESHMHNVPKGSETHFKVVVVSDSFKDKSLIQRHRMVNKLLETELEGGVHALSIVAKTPDQWKDKDNVSPSPVCRGGFGR